MVKFTTTKAPKPYEGGIDGDMMESWETSPDKLTVTFKLRQGMKWDSRAPTNGREIDAQDVAWSWTKFAANNPSAAVESVTAADNRTIVMKLKQPDSALMTTLAGWDQFYPMPRESESQFDP